MDHLVELISYERSIGAPPDEAADRAVARFGSPRQLGAEFNADAARRSLSRASWSLLACVPDRDGRYRPIDEQEHAA